MTIWTIGHSTRTLSEFLDALHSQRIEALADVRKLPGSRRFPQFDQEQLDSALTSEGFLYAHFPELGGRRKATADSHNTAWRHAAFRAYADYMETAEFERAMAGLIALAKDKRTAVMCAEAVWWRCHRSLIADWLKVRGWEVLHIFDARKTQEHPYTGAARLVEGTLSYDPAFGAPARPVASSWK